MASRMVIGVSAPCGRIPGGRAGGAVLLGGDQAVEPGDVSLDGVAVVLAQRPQVGVEQLAAGAATGGARAAQLLDEVGPAALEEVQATGRGQVPAERDLHPEGLVVGGGVVEELVQEDLATLRD